MSEEERLIMGLKLEHPLCAITLSCAEANIVIEQSLELTWGGDINKCRELMEWMFPEGKPNMALLTKAGSRERREKNRSFIRMEDDGKVLEFDVRGSMDQASYLIGAIVRSGGVKYFDRATEVRRKLG